MRGERCSDSPWRGRANGSSPHARGTLDNPPAGDRIGGSSPHARGTPTSQTEAEARERFIPACAGNAIVSRRGVFNGPVHPRMRGERDDIGRLRARAGGSSPHARGTHRDARRRHRRDRFIPACAGNAVPIVPGGAAPTVHPRMRGERSTTRRAGDRIGGSSPHARGTRH